jgi:hypothetical protein
MNLLACELQRRFDAEPSDEEPAGPRFSGRRAAAAAAAALAAGGAAPRLRPRCVAVNPGAVASDIWRGVPARLKTWLLDPAMALAFLSPDEGCATSMHAATQPLPAVPPPTPPVLPCLRWGALPAASAAGDDGGDGGGDGSWAEVPYYAPYFVPRGFPRWLRLPFEAAGPFAGARLCPPSLPPNARAASTQLWGLSGAAVRAAEGVSSEAGRNEVAEALGGWETMAPDESGCHGIVPFGNDADAHQALLASGNK